MRIKALVGMGAAALFVAGCASPRGGSEDIYDYDTISGSDLIYHEDGTVVDLSPDNWPVDDIWPEITRYEEEDPDRMRFPELPLSVH